MRRCLPNEIKVEWKVGREGGILTWLYEKMSAKCEIKVELESGEGGGYFDIGL